jgi:tRNA A-37 threonylcarbamoyl transferase component Bud32/tetratricopeptide (TPR) repeat protein
MDLDIQAVFREVADLTPDERNRYFERVHVPPEVRAEIASLCQFDRRDERLTDCIADVAAAVLHSDAAPVTGNTYGAYKLVRVLGTGGMGTVFLAERADGELIHKVAIKFIRSAFDRSEIRERFLRERQILASLNHPGIARLFDAGHAAAGQPYLVMEYVEGIPLDQFARGLDLRSTLHLILQVCSALAYAHRNLVIHRDLKPSNILVDSAGQAKLLDFGIARIVDEDAASRPVTERLLTPEYASPEQVRGEAQTTTTDVYSLGVVLYRLLTGRSPHARDERTGSAPVETVICSIDPPPPSRVNRTVPRDLDCIVAKALRKEPELRYAGMDAMGEDLRAFLESRPVRARSGSAWYRTRKTLRRHWLPASALAAAMIFLSAGIYVANRQRLIAQQRFSQLRQLADTLLRLDEDLYGLPGSTRVRQKVVAASMQYLEGLSAQAHNDRDLNLDLANGYLLLARVQGVPAYPNLGQYGEADKSLRKAERFAAGAGADKGNLDALLLAAEANQDRMMIADTEQRQADEVDEAQRCAARVELLMRNPAVTKDQLHGCAQLLANVALADSNLHRYDDAVRCARQEVELARSAGASPDYLIGGMGVLANALRWSGDLEGALRAITDARALAESTAFSNETERANVLYGVLNRQGMILGGYDSISLDRPADAVEAFRKAYELMDRRASQDPNDATSRDRMATVGREMADLLVATDPARAIEIYDHSLARLREVKAARRGSRDEALTLARSSYALRRLGRAGEAGARIEAALALLRATKDYPASQVTLGREAETTIRALADQEAATGRRAQALATYRDLLERVTASKPDPQGDLRQANDLSRIFLAMSRLARLTGNSSDAESIEARRVELWRSWEHKLPRNRYVQRQIGASARPPA